MSRSLPFIRPEITFTRDKLPSLSIIVTAKDEAKTLEAGLQSLIEQDYPDYEIIVINDRSTDRTGEIIDRLARQYPQIKPIHIDHLPELWLGKVNALNHGVAQARGDWLLFTDADVHHHTTLWQRAIGYAITNQLDHLALMPGVPHPGKIFQATMKAFAFLFLSTANIEQINNPKSKAAIGIGAFNLVRHSAFKQTPGFEWLRMEVGDDYGIGIMLKQNGFRPGFATAIDDLQVEWYKNIPDMIRGLDKNIMAPGTHFSRFKLIISPIIFSAIILAPYLSLVSIEPPYFIFGFIVFLCTSLISFYMGKSKQENIYAWLLSPVGFLIIGYTFARACILCLIRDGIIWRGTYYPRKLLKKYQRVKV
ncbi:hypothetical protein MNBD_GAMMA21-2071 [hydrothermal vent metagenome]|uniref:Glycosyltransferase 2-like domain-containing protein n=1 Tax=hydrothermal vent metagenome TaxID=652676 RepID=A0A3B0ZUE6_9ZZZZ